MASAKKKYVETGKQRMREKCCSIRQQKEEITNYMDGLVDKVRKCTPLPLQRKNQMRALLYLRPIWP